mgnify:CR=1 FL=1
MALNPWQIVDWFKKKEEDESFIDVNQFNNKEQKHEEEKTIAEEYPDGYNKEWHEHENKSKEHGGPKGAEPTRFGTWEFKGREIDF